MSDVEKFYDEFADQQENVGINRRHLSIDNWLTEFGLKESDRVLEIGCGVGTQTELIAKRVTSGSIMACDISPESVKRAESRLKGFQNVSFLACDIVTQELDGEFDMMILPDVLEHIPIDQHSRLFTKLEKLLAPDGKIVIHIPDPYYLEWRHTQEGEQDKMQVIDQSIFTDALTQAVYPAGLYIEHLQSYSLHVENHDYQIILLRKRRTKTYPPVDRSSSLTERIKGKLGL